MSSLGVDAVIIWAQAMEVIDLPIFGGPTHIWYKICAKYTIAVLAQRFVYDLVEITNRQQPSKKFDGRSAYRTVPLGWIISLLTIIYLVVPSASSFS